MVTKLTKPTKPTKPAKATADKQASARKKAGSGKKASDKKAGNPLSNSVRDSAQQIWQAGLGAFTKAQTEGTKAFEALVKEGASFQRKTHTAAEDRINEATQRMTSMANDISSKASGQWDKLENIFEDRVAKVLHKMGVPSAKDIDVLIERIDALNASVQKLSSARTTDKTTAQTAAVAKAPAKSPRKSAKLTPKSASTRVIKTPAKLPATSAATLAAKAVAKPAAKPAGKVAVKTAAKPAAKAARKKAAPRKAAAQAVTDVAAAQENPDAK